MHEPRLHRAVRINADTLGNAAMAMKGLLANLTDLRRSGFSDSDISLFAVMRADALLAELARGQS